MKSFGGLYAISDSSFGDPVALGKALLSGNPCALQLRCKDWSLSQAEAALRSLLPLCRERGVPLIVNDHPQLAFLADGVHLGQDDGPIDRSLLPKDCIVGRSTHSLDQAQQAVDEGADYLGFGPLFPTQTKATGYSPQGLEQLEIIARSVPLPVVAIGGIQLSHIQAIQACGAAAWAPISAILASENPEEQAPRFTPSAFDTQPTHLPPAGSDYPGAGGHESSG